jgi:hypothetical protein
VRAVHDAFAADRGIPSQSNVEREAFAVHFPELSATLDQWTSANQQRIDNQAAIPARLRAEAARLGMGAPTYSTDAVVDVLAGILIGRSRNGSIGTPCHLQWRATSLPATVSGDDADDTCPAETWLVSVGDRTLYSMEQGNSNDEDQLRREKLQAPIDHLFATAQTWPEVGGFAEGWAAQATQAAVVRARVERDMHHDVIRVSTDCQICRDNLNISDPDG